MIFLSSPIDDSSQAIWSMQPLFLPTKNETSRTQGNQKNTSKRLTLNSSIYTYIYIYTYILYIYIYTHTHSLGGGGVNSDFFIHFRHPTIRGLQPSNPSASTGGLSIRATWLHWGCASCARGRSWGEFWTLDVGFFRVWEMICLGDVFFFEHRFVTGSFLG